MGSFGGSSMHCTWNPALTCHDWSDQPRILMHCHEAAVSLQCTSFVFQMVPT